MLRVVALRKESVDRNLNTFAEGGEVSIVALRKESVDRNVDTTTSCGAPVRSLSARRAWIEIFKLYLGGEQNKVALRKESVDRNISQPMRGKTDEGRSPQGEHGMFLFLTVQGGFVHADIRFNFKNCYKKLSHKII